MAISPITWFESGDTFLLATNFLKAKDIFHVERVCKSWEKAVSELSVWERLFEAENIPEIVGRRPNYKTYVVLRGMFDRGVSVEKIRKYYGEPVGKMPRVSPEKYDLMLEPDPEDPTKRMCETYEAVFTPLAIKRTFGKDLAAALYGRTLIITPLTDSSSTEYELEIPFFFPNLVELSKYPLAGQENGSVFKDVAVVPARCNACALKVGVYFMRSNILEKSRRETFFEQEARVKSLNQEIAPLIVRFFAHSTKIFESGQCPDVRHPQRTFSRTADGFQIESSLFHAIIGGFVLGKGLYVDYMRDDNTADSTGVAPGVSAEA